jgi:hypothetical protein
MGKAEISWKGRTQDGLKREVYARRMGGRWNFFVRERRNDQWQEMEAAPIEDWLQLLDGVQRRIQRRLLRPEEELRVKKRILELFPETKEL